MVGSVNIETTSIYDVRDRKTQFCLFWVLRRINSISVIQRRQFTNPSLLDYFLPVLN